VTETRHFAEKYRAAAARIASKLDYCCCNALYNVHAPQEAIKALADLFREYETSRYGGHWMVNHDEDRYGGSSIVQNRRILALCFMAAIAEADGP